MEITTVDMLIRVLVAIMCGCAIGSERQIHHRTAGLRTNSLVALGACTFAIFDLMNYLNYGNELRVSAQVVSGIGFLCGGVIIKEGFNIKGLTTAATLWVAASAGVLSGMGYLWEAVIVSILVMLINILFKPLVTILDGVSSDNVEYLLKISCDKGDEEKVKKVILNYLEKKKLTLKDIKINKGIANKSDTNIDALVLAHKNKSIENIAHKIAESVNINSISWDKNQ